MSCVNLMNLPRVLIGICAYNEEENIARLLQNLTSTQNLPKYYKILVICSGCTDKTPEIVKNFQKKDERVEVITEKVRRGKANALNKIFKIAKESADVLILVNADAVPERGSIKRLISKLLESNAGAVFAQPVPFKKFHNFCYGVVRVIWRLHHIISLLQKPKLSGELCAIRTACLREIPEKVATDEPYIELAIRQQGWSVLYVPEAIVYIRGPTNIVDLLEQRKRIRIGHLQIHHEANFEVPTSSFKNSLRAFSFLKLYEIPYALLGGFLELIAYFEARLAYSKGKIPYAWKPIKSTKMSI